MGRSRILTLKMRDVLGFVLSGLLLWLTWHQSGIVEEGLQVTSDAWIWLMAAMAVFIFSIVVHAWRSWQVWRNRKGASASWSEAATSLFIGNFFNVVLPGNLGEGIRAWHFHRRTGVGFWRSAAGVLTEKWVDAQIYLASLVVLFFWWADAWSEPVFVTLFAVGAGIIVVDILLAVILAFPGLEHRLWRLVPGRVLRQGLFRTFRHLLLHLRFLRTADRLVVYVFSGIFLLCLNMAQYLLVLYAAGIEGEMAGAASVYLMAVVMVVVNVTPSAPGSIGVVHYGIFAALTLAAKLQGLPQDGASFAMAGIYLHLSYFVPESIVGAIVLWKERGVLTHRFFR